VGMACDDKHEDGVSIGRLPVSTRTGGDGPEGSRSSGPSSGARRDGVTGSGDQSSTMMVGGSSVLTLKGQVGPTKALTV